MDNLQDDTLNNLLHKFTIKKSDLLNKLDATYNNLENLIDPTVLLSTDLIYRLRDTYHMINIKADLDAILNTIKELKPFEIYSCQSSLDIYLYYNRRLVLIIDPFHKTYHNAQYSPKHKFNQNPNIIYYKIEAENARDKIRNIKKEKGFFCYFKNLKNLEFLETNLPRYEEEIKKGIKRQRPLYKKAKQEQKEYIKDLNRVCRFLSSLGYKKQK